MSHWLIIMSLQWFPAIAVHFFQHLCYECIVAEKIDEFSSAENPLNYAGGIRDFTMSH
jgi:hypothetical protein